MQKPIDPNLVYTNGIFTKATNGFSGVNAGQPSVTSDGNVSVPTTQAGSGVWGDLFNMGAAWVKQKYLSPTPPVVMPTPAASAGGVQQLTAPLPGGITIVIPDSTLPPVTTNTTNNGSSGGGLPSGWWMFPLIIVAAIFLIPKLFKRGR